jgi:hypothetical protein
MLNRIEQAPMPYKWTFIVAPFIIALGMYGGTNPVPLSWLALLAAGSAVLVLMFGKDTFLSFFKKMKKGSWKPIFVAIVLGYLVSIVASAVGPLLGQGALQENGIINSLAQPTLWGNIVTLTTLGISLIGEEVITASIAFPVYYLLVKKIGRKQAWIWAALISAALFGMMHFNAYNGNWYQMLIVIGVGRLPFTYAWTKTDSLWGGIIAHVVYDFLIFIPVMMGVL